MKEYYCKVNETNNYTSGYLQKDILNETRPSSGEALTVDRKLPDNAVAGYEAGLYAGRKQVVVWLIDNNGVPDHILDLWLTKLRDWGIR